MKCFRSFTFVSRDAGSFGGTDLDTWSNGLHNFWQVTKLGTSTFVLQGFKNVDVYSIEATGDFFTQLSTGNSAIINNWSFTVQINGKVPLISGFVNSAPNELSMKPAGETPFVQLSRFYPKIEYNEPITSVSSIQLASIKAQGIGNESLTDVSLDWNITFVIKYLYEGEDQEFAFL